MPATDADAKPRDHDAPWFVLRELSEHGTYYGSAWVALGRLWLTTSLLGGCAQH